MVGANIITHHFYGSNIKKYTKTRKLVISLNVKESKNMELNILCNLGIWLILVGLGLILCAIGVFMLRDAFL